MQTYLNNLGIQVSILAGIVILIAATIAPSWYIAGIATVWVIVTIVAVAKAGEGDH